MIQRTRPSAGASTPSTGTACPPRADAYALDGSGARTASDALRAGYTVYTHTATGLRTEAVSYTGAGADGLFGTSDDWQQWHREW